jgi:Rad3-related DNA helicase
MIWITTLCLLTVALWLFFNALNERRWVEAHSHDETVASDEGLLPSLTGLTKTANTSPDGGTPSYGQETALDRAAAKLKISSEKLGGQVTDAKKSAGEMYERARQSEGALGENSTVGRLASKTREKASALNQKLDAVMKSASSLTTGSSDGNSESFLNKAAATSGNFTQKVAQSVKKSADNLSGNTNASGDESVISKIAGKVSDGMSAVDQKLDRASAKRSAAAAKDD